MVIGLGEASGLPQTPNSIYVLFTHQTMTIISIMQKC